MLYSATRSKNLRLSLTPPLTANERRISSTKLAAEGVEAALGVDWMWKCAVEMAIVGAMERKAESSLVVLEEFNAALERLSTGITGLLW